MDLFNRQNVLIRRNSQTAVCTFVDAEHRESVAEIFIRNHRGIHYLRKTYTGSLPDSATLYYETYRAGLYSPRPYHLQLPSDESVLHSVLALSAACCQAWNLDPTELVKIADPRAQVSAGDWLTIKDLARWQDTVFPGQWNTATIESLSQVLVDVKCEALGALILKRTVRARGY